MSPIERDEHERRRHPRRAVVLPAELDVTDDGRHVAGVTVDLSLGGARILADAPLDPGTTALVAVTGDDRTIVTLADVLASTVDTDKGVVEMRLQFREMCPTRRKSLARLIGR